LMKQCIYDVSACTLFLGNCSSTINVQTYFRFDVLLRV
jgi:hypothetical protein